MSGPLRSVIRNETFAKQLQDIKPGARRADEFMRGIEWILSRHPESGTQVGPNYHVWAFPVLDALDLPELIVYYTFNDDNVWLLSIKRAKDITWHD